MVLEQRWKRYSLSLGLGILDVFTLITVFSFVFRFRMSFWADWLVVGTTLDGFAVIHALTFYLFDVYRPRIEMKKSSLILRVLLAVLIGAIFSVVVTYLRGPEHRGGMVGRGVFLASTFIFGCFAVSYRLIIYRWIERQVTRGQWLFIGPNFFALEFWKDIRSTYLAPQFTFITEGLSNQSTDCPIRDNWSHLGKWMEKPWTGIVFARGVEFPPSVQETLMKGRLKGLVIFDLADFYEELWTKIPIYYLGHSWFILSRGFLLQKDGWHLRLKRLLDILIAGCLFLIILPILPIIALIIALESKGPVIYRQIRSGEGESLFTILKFRTMVTGAEQGGAQWSQEGDYRITRIGGVLRKLRLDELPQLFNILRGDMSFIGPRPERPEFNGLLEGEIPYFVLRSLVKPGLTGWAQVNYPYGATVDDSREKLQFDLYYLKNYSLWLDLLILLRTFRVVLGARGR